MKTNLLILILFGLLGTNAFANEELVMNSETSFIPTHHNRLSFIGGVNPSLQKASDVKALAFSYGKKFNDYWIDSTFAATSGLFNKMTTNNPTATGLISDNVDSANNSMISFGVGIGRETQYAQTLLPFNNLYEVISADLTYNMYKEKTSGLSFNGPGMIAKFSLFKKFSDYISFGPQFIYNLAVVKRSANNDTETSSVRSLTMSNLTVGFDLSFYL